MNDNNIVVPLKRFDNNDYIDIVFTVNASRGVTEYKVSESVDNNTGLNWSGYRMQLGFGTGANFSMSPAGDGLDFDAPLFDPPFPPSPNSVHSTTMPAVVLGEDELVFSGNQGTGLGIFNFRIDVPDGLLNGAFTLRQFPVPVPEPTTAVTLLLAALIVPALARRSR